MKHLHHMTKRFLARFTDAAENQKTKRTVVVVATACIVWEATHIALGVVGGLYAVAGMYGWL